MGLAINRACSSHIARLQPVQPPSCLHPQQRRRAIPADRTSGQHLSQRAGAATDDKTRATITCHGPCALTVVDVEFDGLAFADMAAGRTVGGQHEQRISDDDTTWWLLACIITLWYCLQNPGLLVLIVMICGWKSSPCRCASCA